jgi:hypothetical protein
MTAAPQKRAKKRRNEEKLPETLANKGVANFRTPRKNAMKREKTR